MAYSAAAELKLNVTKNVLDHIRIRGGNWPHDACYVLACEQLPSWV